MKLTFYGGAKSVTGANYLLEISKTKILVDCGMFQGSRYSEDLNYEKFSYDPGEINFGFITHSHTDHSGRLPKLYKEGFRGKVFATNATIDLIKTALPDNLNLIKQEAKDIGHEPLFDLRDLEGVMSLAEGVSYAEAIDLGEGAKAVLHDAGHILGSAIVEIQYPLNNLPLHPHSSKTSEGYSKVSADAQFFTSSHILGEKTGKIYFTGDLGNPPTPLLCPPKFINNASFVVIESAYGSRIHEDKAERNNIFGKMIIETVERGGTLMIPSFAMERTQELLYELNSLIENHQIPRVPIFVDSPLAINLTKIYKKYPDYFNKEAAYLIDSGDDIFNFPGLEFTRTIEESKKINDTKGPKVIIAGSGMSNGGRILYHEQKYLPDLNSAILFVGYQVKGSLGRRILDGEKEVRILGQKVVVNCKIEAIGGYSAHADQNMLLKWVTAAAKGGKLKKVFVVQGEEDSSLALARKIESVLSVDVVVPNPGESFELNLS